MSVFRGQCNDRANGCHRLVSTTLRRLGSPRKLDGIQHPRSGSLEVEMVDSKCDDVSDGSYDHHVVNGFRRHHCLTRDESVERVRLQRESEKLAI